MKPYDVPARRTVLAVVVGLLLALWGNAALAEGGGMSLDGAVDHPLALTAADLAAMPATEVQSSFATEHGPQSGRYKGVLLWSLVERAGFPPASEDKHGRLRHTLLISGRDGYVVSLSIGEIDPDFAGKEAIIAYDRDGKPMDALRLIVPGDQHGGRAVRDVVRVEVR